MGDPRRSTTFCLVTDGVHCEQSAHRASNKTNTEQTSFGNAVAIVVSIRRDILIPRERNKGNVVNNCQVDAKNLEPASVPSREDAINVWAQSDKAITSGDDERPYCKADYGWELS